MLAVQEERGPRKSKSLSHRVSTASHSRSMRQPYQRRNSITAPVENRSTVNPLCRTKTLPLTLPAQMHNGASSINPLPVTVSPVTATSSPITGIIHRSSHVQHQQILLHILAACLSDAHGNEHFRRLDRRLQQHLLRHVWPECFVLRAAHWSIDVGAIVEQCDCPTLRLAMRRARDVRADFTELQLLETVVLCRPDLATGAAEHALLEQISDGAVQRLAAYALQQHRTWTRFGRMLLGLRAIVWQAPMADCVLTALMRHVVEHYAMKISR